MRGVFSLSSRDLQLPYGLLGENECSGGPKERRSSPKIEEVVGDRMSRYHRMLQIANTLDFLSKSFTSPHDIASWPNCPNSRLGHVVGVATGF